MKKLYYLLSMAFLWSHSNVQAQCTNNYYVVNHNPWGQTFNQTAMTNVFGAPNWTQANYSTPAATIFAPGVCFVMLEGGENNDTFLNNFLNANLPIVETWVNNGGRLFINSAGWNTSVSCGFGGTTLVYPAGSSTATAVNVNDPIFLGPYLPTATSYTGSSYSHNSVTGTGLGILLTGQNGTILANKYWGNGIVFFGGITSPNFHTPNTEAVNLWYNIFHYAANIPLCATNQTLTATNPVICPNTSTTITTGASENNVLYYLRNNANNAIVDGPIAGTGSSVTFNTGNLATTTTFNVLGARDYAIDLPLSNDYVRYAAPFSTYGNEITIESWVYSTSGQFPWAGQSTAGADNMGTNVWIWHNNQFFVNDAGTWRTINLPVLTPGWTHITTVANPAGLFVYYNGVLVVSNAAGITGNIVNNVNSIIDLGQDPRFPAGTTGRNSNTAFDNFRVWNYARTQAEISGSMSTCLTGTEPGLALNTKFDEGISTSILSATGSSATINNPSTNWITGSLTCFACEVGLASTVTVTVQDNAPTVASTPANITINNDLGSCGAVVTYSAPTFDDDCDGNGLLGTMTAGLASGSNFPIGSTTVTYQYTDASSQSVSTSFTVTVNDTENPTITAPAAVTVSADAGSCVATGVGLGTPATADNCTVASVTNNAPGSFPLGTTTVIWTVTDGSGNTATATQTVTVEDNEAPVFVNVPAAITITANNTGCTGIATWTSPTASDNCAGGVTITASHNSGDAFPLGITTVTYTAEDAAGNTTTVSFSIEVINDLNPSNIDVTDVSCNGGNDGEIDITFSGGTAPLTFLWTNTGGFSSTDQNLTGLTAGDYDGVTTDANGCTSSGTVTVNEPTAITIISVVEDVNCNGGSDGEIDLTVAGGAPNYTFSWTDGGAFSSTDEDLTGLSAGVYEVTITDDNNCVATLSVTVNEPTTLAASATSTDETLGNDGTIDLTVTGGTAPYSFSWTDGAAFSSTDEDLSGLSAGTYQVTITDDNGCTTTLQVVVGSVVGLTEINLIEFNLFPNPTNDLYTISVSTSGTLEVYGNNGQLVSTESIESGKTIKDVHQLATGVYTIRFVTENGVAVKRLVVNK
jgi:hypothetical protein